MSSSKPTYDRRRADNLCTRCGCGKLPEWGDYAYCPTCREENAKRLANQRKAKASSVAAWQQAYKVRHRAKVNGARRDFYLTSKVSGQCVECAEPADEESNFCAKHRERHREACVRWRRKRSAA